MNIPDTPILISYSSDEEKIDALKFSKISGYPCIKKSDVNSSLHLNYSSAFVELCDSEKNICIHIDFLSGNLAHRQQFGGGRSQSIAKAIGLKQGTPPPTVLDATAGLAKDAYVLACLGCSMTLLERSPILVELIRDAIERAKKDEHFKSIIDTGFELIEDSSIHYLNSLADTINPDIACSDIIYPDVIYLDPMYPDRKKSASVKKNMQILQTLLGKDEDTQELLDAALKVAKKRVVVKRPKGSARLSDIKPTYQVSSKNTRYDIYIIQQ
ncbi:MAG: class I SAM-dependent methyltransferase [Gammaproteobacteria bacterium]|nr:class I SAM-dependent methyltransferase [Gammaproteobacteria bacterium]